MQKPSRKEIEKGHYSRARLAAWGVGWPPPKGWRKRLLREADRCDGTGAREGVRNDAYQPGEQHRCWPEWTWDGKWFVRTDSL